MSGMYLCAPQTRMKHGLFSLSSSTTRHEDANWCLFMIPMNSTHRCDLSFSIACELSCRRVLKGHPAVRFLVVLYQSSCCVYPQIFKFSSSVWPVFCSALVLKGRATVWIVYITRCKHAMELSLHPIATQWRSHIFSSCLVTADGQRDNCR